MVKKHWEYESVQKANQRSSRKIYSQFQVRLHKDYEADILEKLDSVPNKRQYIISLIREDILKNKGKE